MPVSCAHLRHPNVFGWLLLALAVAFRARDDVSNIALYGSLFFMGIQAVQGPRN
jgi:hypothetical protein